MGRPYSIDLRERAVAAVEKGGMSRRQAAAQFGVGVSTVIAWVRLFRKTGSVVPGKMGGHKPKAIAGAHRIWLLRRIDGKDFTIRGWSPSSPSVALRSIIVRCGTSSMPRN